ncbi:MAG: DUF4189 domain-containing protein [Marivibrio sp.]|uniref:DUF4189 domain-containing protein n=1 Tax=Marivibrio sp. TaxID=2039719 RepID=UPI0032EF17D1
MIRGGLFAALSVLVLAGCAAVSGMLPEEGADSGAPYGAAAFSPSSRDWALATDEASPAAAADTATAECGGGDCAVIVRFDRGLRSALALDVTEAEPGPFVAVSSATERGRAQAMESCDAAGGEDCMATPAVCN